MLKCEKCNKDLFYVSVRHSNHAGGNYNMCAPICEPTEKTAYINIKPNWTGYNKTQEEMKIAIRCPYCNQYPFINEEIQAYDIVQVVMFKSSKEERNENLHIRENNRVIQLRRKV